MYGTQAESGRNEPIDAFENDVKMYGTQAKNPWENPHFVFENDVKMYGTQACMVGCIKP